MSIAAGVTSKGTMKIRRTISIDRNDLETIKPILESNGNNLSLAIRQLVKEYRQKTDANRITDDQQKKMMLRNQVIEKRIAELIPVPLVKWFLKRSHGVPPLGTFRVIMEKYIRLLGMENLSLDDYIKLINIHSDIFGYQIRQNIEVSPESRNIRILFEAEDSEHLKGSVVNFSCILAHHPLTLKTRGVMESPGLIIVEYERCSSEEEAYRSVVENFGYNQFVYDEIQGNIQFWGNIARILKADHYDNIVVSREIFLQILKSHDFSDELNHLISIVFGVSIEDTGYRDIVRYIGEICRTCGLIHKIEHGDNEIRVYHKFSDGNLIHLVNSTIIMTLKTANQHFILRKEDKMTVLSMESN